MDIRGRNQVNNTKKRAMTISGDTTDEVLEKF